MSTRILSGADVERCLDLAQLHLVGASRPGIQEMALRARAGLRVSGARWAECSKVNWTGRARPAT